MKLFIVSLLFLATVFACSNNKDSHPTAKSTNAETAKVVFKSGDGGQSWEDISEGLPQNLQTDSLPANSFFANEAGLFLRMGSELYQNMADAANFAWTKKAIHGEESSFAKENSARALWGVNLNKADGTSIWSPIFEDPQGPRLRSVFETAGGLVFIATDRGIFRTSDNGNTWKQIFNGALVGNLAESNGILLTTSMGKIIRSTDNGDSWAPVISEDNVAFDVKPFRDGFVAITADTESGKRRLSISTDDGNSWKSTLSDQLDQTDIDSIRRTWNDRINDRLRSRTFMISVVQFDNDFLSVHPKGIYRSLDNGKTWKLLLPSLGDKVFNLFISGKVIYAVRSKGGC